MEIIARKRGQRIFPEAVGMLFFCFFSLFNSLVAQKVEIDRMRVPAKLDRADILTDMLLEFEFERIETEFLKYEGNDDTDLQSIDQFVDAMVGGDIERALSLTFEIPGTSRESSRELLEAFSGMLSNAPDALRLERMIHLGPDRLLLWSLPIEENERFYRSFRFVRDEDGIFRYEGVATEPVSSLINYAFQVDQGNQSEVGDPDREYSYPFPGTEEAPVRLAFDGITLDLNAFDPVGVASNPVIAFFNEAMATLKGGTAEAYAAFFSEFSQKRYIDWSIDQGPEAYEAYRSDMVNYGARVVFLLEAAPMYLVFYLPTDNAVKGAPLRYMSIYDNPQTGFELTNFYVFGLTDTILRRREYFEEPFLRPLLKSSGTIPARSERETIDVTAGETALPDVDQMAEALELPREEEGVLPENIDDLSRDGVVWPWIMGGLFILILFLIVVLRRNRKD